MEIICNKNRKVVVVSSDLPEAMGAQQEQLVGHFLSDLISQIVPVKLIEDICLSLDTGQNYSTTIRLKGRNSLWVVITASRVYLEGKHAGFRVMMKKASESEILTAKNNFKKLMLGLFQVKNGWIVPVKSVENDEEENHVPWPFIG